MTRPDDDPGVTWMLAWREGDEGAFDDLVHHYSGRVWALVTRFLGSNPRCEDLVQETFLRVIRARDRYQPTARFSTWLYRIVFNLCVNEHERGVGRSALSLEGSSAGDEEGLQWADERVPQPGDELEEQDVVGAVRSAIARLPERQRMALLLAKYEELPYAEIARVLETSEKAIKSMIHRARENLRATLAPFLQEETA